MIRRIQCPFTARLICRCSLPGDAKQVAADLPQLLGRVVIRSRPWAPCRSAVTVRDRERPLHTWVLHLCECCIRIKNPQLHKSALWKLLYITNCRLAEILRVPEVPSALAVQAWLHGTVDGGLCSLQCCLGENPEDLHCHLDTLVLVSPQVRLHHPRVQGEHTHPCTCNMYTPTQSPTHILYIHILHMSILLTFAHSAMILHTIYTYFCSKYASFSNNSCIS